LWWCWDGEVLPVALVVVLEDNCWPETRLCRDTRAETAGKMAGKFRVGKNCGKENGPLSCAY
jgi:hypothetical protein